MEKHPLNILPEMSEDEKKEMRDDLLKNGFNRDFPIFTYQEKVLDGWNRYLLSEELEIEPVFKAKDAEFSGNDESALEFVIQVNTRRNLSSSQKAALAVESEALIKKLKADTEKLRREKQAKTKREKKDGVTGAENEVRSDADISSAANLSEIEDSPDAFDEFSEDEESGDPESDEHESKTAAKLAEKFGTNRTYINDAAKLKTENPAEFEKVKSGEKSLSQAKKDTVPKTRTYFEEISFHFAEYGRVLKKLQEFAAAELVSNLHGLYPQILGVTVEDFEKQNAEIAGYEICEKCGGAGCTGCRECGFLVPAAAQETD